MTYSNLLSRHVVDGGNNKVWCHLPLHASPNGKFGTHTTNTGTRMMTYPIGYTDRPNCDRSGGDQYQTWMFSTRPSGNLLASGSMQFNNTTQWRPCRHAACLDMLAYRHVSQTTIYTLSLVQSTCILMHIV